MLRCLVWRSAKFSGRYIEVGGIDGLGRLFACRRNLSHSKRSFVDENNVFRSPYGDVEIPSVYLHEHIYKNIDKWWDKTALVCATTGRSYTYGELRRLSGRFATSLRRKNLLPGDTLAIVLPNVPEYAIVMLGASEAGVNVTLINPSYTAYEIRKQLENSESKAVITTHEKYPTIMESIQEVNKSMRSAVIVIPSGSESTPPGTINFRDLVANDVEEFERIGEATGVDFERDTMMLPYSSGTTGLPKGVELTHRNVIANLCQMMHPEYHYCEPTSHNFQEVVPLFLPLYHIYGLILGLYQYLCVGGKNVLMPQFTANNLLNVMEKNPVTALFVAPPVLQLIVNDERFGEKHMKFAKFVMSAAAPVSRDFIRKFRTKMGDHFEFCQGYGLTEMSPIITRGKRISPESVGLIVPNTEIRIVGKEDDNLGRNLGVNQRGELLASGPQVMKGYYKNPEATRGCMDGQWFKTGDLAYVDGEGQVYITGRLKELIKVSGFQVSPVELESLIHGHEKVVDAAVIGVPHERFGEIPKAFVVPKSGAKVTEEEIKNFVAERLSRHKQLGHVVFVDGIPKSAAGKILRRELQKF